MEEKIYHLVSSIQGVGEAQVWVTLESGVEYVYLQEEVRNTDTTKDYDSEGVKTLREKDNSEQKYILVNKNGEEQPLIQKQLEPTVQGVVVVCEGASSAQVNEQIVNAVTCALRDHPELGVCHAADKTLKINEMNGGFFHEHDFGKKAYYPGSFGSGFGHCRLPQLDLWWKRGWIEYHRSSWRRGKITGTLNMSMPIPERMKMIWK